MIPFYRLSLLRDPSSERVKFDSVGDVARFCAETLRDEPNEAFLVVYFDGYARAIGSAIPYRGVMDTVMVEPRGVFGPAILANAVAIVIAHNHPCGSSKPSKADILMTQRLVLAGTVLGVDVKDHFVVGDDGAVSIKNLMAANGMDWEEPIRQWEEIQQMIDSL